MSKISRYIIAAAVFMLIVGGLVLYGVLHGNSNLVSEDAIGNTASNLANGGLFAETDSMVFFANPYNDNCLYAMKKDGTGIKRISALSARHINAWSDKVFFFGERVESGTGLGSVAGKPGIFSVNSDGKHLSQLTSLYVSNMLLAGNRIFFTHAGSDNLTFEVYDFKKQKSTELLPHALESYTYVPGYLYYAGRDENMFLYSYDIGLGYESEIWQGIVYAPIYDNGFIYYIDVMNNYRLCRYSMIYNTIEILTEDRLDFFNLHGNVIFYQKSSQVRPALKRINIDGTDETVIAEGTFTNLSVTSDYAYFTEFGHTVPLYRTPTYLPPNVTEFTEARDAALKEISAQKGNKKEEK